MLFKKKQGRYLLEDWYVKAKIKDKLRNSGIPIKDVVITDKRKEAKNQ